MRFAVFFAWAKLLPYLLHFTSLVVWWFLALLSVPVYALISRDLQHLVHMLMRQMRGQENINNVG